MNISFKKNQSVFSVFVFSIVLWTLFFTLNTSTLNMLVLMVIVTTLFYFKSLKELDFNEYKNMLVLLVFVFFVFFVLGVMPTFYYGLENFPHNLFHNKGGAVLAVLFLGYLLVLLRPSEKVVWWSLTLGGLSILSVIFYEIAVYGLQQVLMPGHRVGTALGGSMVLKFGVFSSLYIAVLLGGYVWAIKTKSWLLMVLLTAAIFVALSGTLLTGTRGAWVGLPEIFLGWGIFYYYYIFRHLKVGLKIAIVTLILLSAMIFYEIAGNKVTERIKLAISDVETYLDGNPNTSVGLRFLMYEGALLRVKNSPVFGVGDHKIESELTNGMDEAHLARFGTERQNNFSSWDVHNQYLQEYFGRGIFGLLALIIIQLGMLLLFIKHSRLRNDDNPNVWAISGIIFIIASATNMMSYSWLRFNVGVFFYFTIVTLLFYMSNRKFKEEDKA